MIKCSCISEDIKKVVGQSNLPDDLKNQIETVHTCGVISTSDIFDILKSVSIYDTPYRSQRLEPVIHEMMQRGLTKAEVDERMLELRKRNKIYLEVGTPIGASEKELAEQTIKTPFARFAYVKWKK